MKSLAILVLFVAVCAVFLGVGHTEETADDFKEAVLEDVEGNTKDESQLTDSFKNREDDNDDNGNDDDDDDEGDNDEDDDDDESENAVDGVNETPSNDEDEPEMFKRAPWRRRRRRRRFFRRVVRRVKDKMKKFKPCLKTICGFVKNSKSLIVKFACRLVKKLKDEPEHPFLSSDETFIEAHEADELVKQGYVKE